MLTATIRQNFLQYFKSQGHTLQPSSPVVPHEDPTLLFTNAGMNQFKDVFLGNSIRDYKRAATSQKCVRVGGKHNDLENVGHTARHLTFFEMLGNFSFGDYFKEQAIRFAWEVATEVFELEEEKIWATVFTTDDEAYELWKTYLPESRITRFDEKENFWAMGDTGPCGPCSELLFDRGDAYGTGSNPHEDPAGDRFLEFWNLVFMQYNRSSSGEQSPLPKPCVDTGAGLERIVALKMGVDCVFETDIFRALIAEIEGLCGKKHSEHVDLQAAFHVIADHLRCLAFAIADGAQPSNVDRGYVLRKVLRRAVRYGRQLGLEKPFMAQLLPRLTESMGEAYPELRTSQERTAELLTLEEESFLRTLRRGGNLLQRVVKEAHAHGNTISGDDAFKLKDTYGMPLEEIELFAKDAELKLDHERFAELDQQARERSRQARQSSSQEASQNLFEAFASKHGPTQFTGYDNTEGDGTVTAIVVDGAFVDSLEPGQEAMVVLDSSPFYAEMGGQVGDTGSLSSDDFHFEVHDCRAPFKGVIAHIGRLKDGQLKLGSSASASVDAARRQRIANNHSATHLLHWALVKVLGEHVRQAGSVVEPGRLRFDFSHHKAVSPEEIRQIEDMVNERIRGNVRVDSYELDYDEVQKRSDIKQFFGDKYDAKVRVVDIDYSKELCGGTHTSSVGTIGYFRITQESSIAAGVRRIVAVSGSEAEAAAREPERLLEDLAASLKSAPAKLQTRVEKLLEENKQLQKQLKDAATAQMGQVVEEVLGTVEDIQEVPLLAAKVNVSGKQLKDMADKLMAKLDSAILLLAADDGQRCSLLARVTPDLVSRGFKANELLSCVAPLVEGRGGGKPESAQAGGQAPDKIPEALAEAKSWVLKQGQQVG